MVDVNEINKPIERLLWLYDFRVSMKLFEFSAMEKKNVFRVFGNVKQKIQKNSLPNTQRLLK